MSNALSIDGLSVSYGPIPALKNVSIEVPNGGFVTVLGANGAGKTTLVRTISGVLYLQKGKRTSGSIKFGGQEISKSKSRSIVRGGIAHVPEGRMLFPQLTVEVVSYTHLTLPPTPSVYNAVGVLSLTKNHVTLT